MTKPDLRPSPEEEWQALLSHLRQQAQAQPRPFFYARVQARLSARRATPLAWLPGWVRRPAYAALLGTLVLAVSGDAAPPGASHPSQLSSPLPR